MHPETFELNYVKASKKYESDYDSKEDGQLYYLKSQQVHTVCTPNHKNFIKKRNHTNFELVEAKNCFGKRLQYKKNCINAFPEYESIEFKQNDKTYSYNFNSYLKLLGMFISDGCCYENAKNTQIIISCIKQRKIDYINKIAEELNIHFNYITSHNGFVIGKTYIPGMYEEFKELSVGAINKTLPNYIWDMGIENCNHLLDGLINGDGSKDNSGSISYCTSSKKLANDVQRLALHCGYSANIKLSHPAGTITYIKDRKIISKNDNYSIRIVKSKNEKVENAMAELFTTPL